jgi:hypothetical protein
MNSLNLLGFDILFGIKLQKTDFKISAFEIAIFSPTSVILKFILRNCKIKADNTFQSTISKLDYNKNRVQNYTGNNQ